MFFKMQNFAPGGRLGFFREENLFFFLSQKLPLLTKVFLTLDPCFVSVIVCVTDVDRVHHDITSSSHIECLESILTKKMRCFSCISTFRSYLIVNSFDADFLCF